MGVKTLMVQCPRCSCEFPLPKNIALDDDKDITLCCPSCKNTFSIKIQCIAIKVSEVK